MFGYPMERFVVDLDIELCLFSESFYLIFRWNSTAFLVDVRVIDYHAYIQVPRYPFFKRVLILMYALRILERCFKKSERGGSLKDTRDCHVLDLQIET